MMISYIIDSVDIDIQSQRRKSNISGSAGSAEVIYHAYEATLNHSGLNWPAGGPPPTWSNMSEYVYLTTPYLSNVSLKPPLTIKSFREVGHIAGHFNNPPPPHT